jgi:succinate dehydrogenase / fumarate reductase iron-sulfur subunit
VIQLDPLNHMPVQKDLMVDQTIFLSKFKAVEPYFKPKNQPPAKGEYLQSAEERAVIDEATKCINCGVPAIRPVPFWTTTPTSSVRPPWWPRRGSPSTAGDEGLKSRLDIIDQPNAVWSCDNHFECTKVCPRDIKITKLINFTKKAIKKHKEGTEA